MAIFVSAGHNLKDPGATGNGFTEAIETRKIREKVLSFIPKEYKVIKDDDNWDLSQTMVNFQTGEGSACLDIHFNASANSAATGVEVIHPDNPSPDELHFARALSQQLSNIMKIKNRGAIPESQTARKRLGMMRENGINLLVEVCFISNAHDVKAYQDNFGAICECMAAILMNMDDKVK